MTNGNVQKDPRKTGFTSTLFLGSYGLLFLVMFLLPFFSCPGTSILQNSLYHLGAQSAPHAWIMNLSLLLLGTGCLAVGWTYTWGTPIRRIFFLLASLSFLLTAIFNQAPAIPGLPVDRREDGWHSYFTCTSVISFLLFTLSTAFIQERKTEKRTTLLVFFLFIILLVLMTGVEQWKGIWQRLLFILSFGWISKIITTKKDNQHINIE